MPPKFEKRVRAYAIDISAVMVVVLVMAFLDTIPPIYRVIPMLVAMFIFWILPYFFSNGQTFGKRVEKIKIVNMDGSNCSLLKLIAREIVKQFLAIVTVGIYLIIAYFVLSEKTVSRTIHDYFFGTKEIDLEKRPKDDSYEFLNKKEKKNEKNN